jgi:hypothetical protein
MRSGVLAALIVSALVLPGSPVVRGQEKPAQDDRGQVVTKKVRYGEYVQYRPKREAVGVLVVIHGQPAGNDIKDIHGLAERFCKRWIEFAEPRGLAIIAPVFNNENFDSVDGNQGGGYRGLFGRQVAADAYVNDMIDRTKPLVAKGWDGRIVLYGQMPDPEVAWPNGAAPLVRTMEWGPSKEPQAIKVVPSLNGWVKAASLPITVVVGQDDTEPQKRRAGHTGSTRVEFARQWVASMNKLAERRRQKGTVQLKVIDGVGHDSAKLTPAAQEALAGYLDGK